MGKWNGIMTDGLNPATLNGATSVSATIFDEQAHELRLAGAQTHFELSQFYFLEAEFLDDGRFTDWLDMLSDDLHYWAPIRTNRLRRQQALSISDPGEAAFYDETKESLAWRIRRYDSGMAWAEDPPSRTRHLISNISARERLSDGLLQVRSAFIVYRNRLHTEVDLYAGGRNDILRRAGTHGFEVVKRTILFEQNVLLMKNISTFF